MCKFNIHKRLCKVDNLLCGHVELPHVFDLAVQLAVLVNGIILIHFTPSLIKVLGGDCPCDSSVSPSPLGFDFGLGLGLDNKHKPSENLQGRRN